MTTGPKHPKDHLDKLQADASAMHDAAMLPRERFVPEKPFEILSGNHVYRAVPRGEFGWDVEIIASGPFASGLSKKGAALCMRRLKQAHITKKPAERLTCPTCSQIVVLDTQGRYGTHGVAPPHGTWQRCTMSARKP